MTNSLKEDFRIGGGAQPDKMLPLLAVWGGGSGSPEIVYKSQGGQRRSSGDVSAKKPLGQVLGFFSSWAPSTPSRGLRGVK